MAKTTPAIAVIVPIIGIVVIIANIKLIILNTKILLFCTIEITKLKIAKGITPHIAKDPIIGIIPPIKPIAINIKAIKCIIFKVFMFNPLILIFL